MGVLQRAGECVAGQAVGQAVGLGDGVFQLAEATDGGHGAKGLVVEHLGRQRHICQHGGLPEVAGGADTFTAQRQRGALLHGVLGELGHGGQAARVGQRAHGCAFRRAITNLQAAGVLGQCCAKFFLDAFVHQEARGRNTHLARVAELGGTGRLDGQRNVGVFTHDDRGVAAQLHRHTLHVLACQRGQLFAHRRGAGERDLANDGVGDQVAGDFGGVAIHQAHHTGGQARVGKSLDQCGGCGRGFFGCLDQHRATTGQRCRQLAHHLVDREVPRRERGHGAHRVLQHQLAHGQVARGHDAAVDAHAFIGKPFNDVGRGHGFTLGFRQGFAVFLRQHGADVGGTFAHQRSSAAHDLGTLKGGHVAPHFKPLLGSGQGAVQVRNARVRHTANFQPGGRIKDGQCFAIGGVLPFTGNKKACVGVSHEVAPVGGCCQGSRG